MGDAEKKRLKAEAKRAKKEAKAKLKAASRGPQETADAGEPPPSAAVRYAELVRGVLYALLGASLVVALILGQQDVIVSLDDLIDSLFAAVAGKIILGLIAVALVIYGLKHLRLVR